MNWRTFLRVASLGGGTLLMSGALSQAVEKHEQGRAEEEVSPAEDLMREHGVLKRLLLVYQEAGRRIEAREDLPPEPLADVAKTIRDFIENYHEKLEENYLFPRFHKAGKHIALVNVLLQQHQARRRLTDLTIQFSTAQVLQNPDDRKRLARALREFTRMYEPHEAREDTVLFPSFRTIVTSNEYDALGEDFEKKEHELFGEDGFGKTVDRVAGIEKTLGIYELAQFTPKV